MRRIQALDGYVHMDGIARARASGKSLRPVLRYAERWRDDVENTDMSVTPTPWQADPATRDLFAKIEAAQVPPMHTQTPAEARSGILASRDNDIDPPPISRVENRTIPGPGGDLAIRCYYPKQVNDQDGEGLPTLLY
ncbi:MAG: hypothetical protein ACI9DC_005216, partial [Gammaproteobacteria bacterium]